MRRIFAFLTVFVLVVSMTTGAFAQEAGMGLGDFSPSISASAHESTPPVSGVSESIIPGSDSVAPLESEFFPSAPAVSSESNAPSASEGLNNNVPISADEVVEQRPVFLLPREQMDGSGKAEDTSAAQRNEEAGNETVMVWNEIAKQGPVPLPECLEFNTECDGEGDNSPIVWDEPIVSQPWIDILAPSAGDMISFPCPTIVDLPTGESISCQDGEGSDNEIPILLDPLSFGPRGNDSTVNPHSTDSEPQPCIGMTDMKTKETTPCPSGDGEPSPAGGTQNAEADSSDSGEGVAILFTANPLWIKTIPSPSAANLETPDAHGTEAALEQGGPDPAIVALADGRIRPESIVLPPPAPAPPANPIAGFFTSTNTPLIGIGLVAILGMALYYARGRKNA
jgi:hypothetical protein